MIYTDISKVNGSFTVLANKYEDNRGFFQEFYNENKYNSKVNACRQISYSKSNKNIVRGIHCSPYGKLVQCIHGEIIDYVIDLRPDSSTYLNWESVTLSANIPLQLYIPPNCGHAFFSKQDNSLVLYLQEGTYNPTNEMNVNPFDPRINILWPKLEENKNYILSKQDNEALFENEARKLKK